MKRRLGRTCQLDVTLEEIMRSWHGQFKRQYLEDQMLHTQNLLLGVRIVGDVHKFSNLWWINLFVFPAT